MFVQSITDHPQFSTCVTTVSNDEIARFFSEKLTSMEYILYNVPVTPDDVFNGKKNRDEKCSHEKFFFSFVEKFLKIVETKNLLRVQVEF